MAPREWCRCYCRDNISSATPSSFRRNNPGDLPYVKLTICLYSFLSKKTISKEADKPKLQTLRMAIPRNKYLWGDNEWQKGIILTATKSWLHTETWHKRHSHDDCDTLNYLSRKDIEENTYRSIGYRRSLTKLDVVWSHFIFTYFWHFTDPI